jgi:hypothetical protein
MDACGRYRRENLKILRDGACQYFVDTVERRTSSGSQERPRLTSIADV